MKRYKTTAIKDKRSIVRALNTFSQQYDFILCDNKFVDLEEEPVVYHYRDDNSEYFKNIIYSKDLAQIDIRDTKLLIDAVNNLISLNRKDDIKQLIISAIKDYDNGFGLNRFLLNKELAIKNISFIVDNEKFAKKIYSQIENRIKFYRSGVYRTNETDASIKSKTIYILPTNKIEIFIKKLKLCINNFFLFTYEIKKEVEQIDGEIKLESTNRFYSDLEIDNENNTGLYHPIDEQSYLEEKNDSHLNLAKIVQRDYNIYNKRLYARYEKLSKTFEQDKEFILENMQEIFKYSKLEERVFSQINDFSDEEYSFYEEFYELLDENKEKIRRILFKETEDIVYSEFDIKKLQKEILRSIDDWAPYPIDNYEEVLINMPDALEMFLEEFDLDEESFFRILNYK